MPIIGGVGDNFKNEFERKLNYGASIGWMGAGIIGFEADFGYSPNFFRVDNNSNNINLVGDGNVTTLMGNLVVGAPLGPFHPYASGGVGLLKTSVDDAAQFLDASRNDFGYDVGGGLMLGGPDLASAATSATSVRCRATIRTALTSRWAASVSGAAPWV